MVAAVITVAVPPAPLPPGTRTVTLALLCIVERIETGYVAAEQVTSLLDAVVNPRQAHAAPGASSSAAASSREAAPARRAFTPDPPMATAGGGGG